MSFDHPKISELYSIDENSYKRFDEKNNMIYRRLWDKRLSTYRQMFGKNITSHIASRKEGYTRIDFAFVKAGWTVYEKFPFAFAWEKDNTENVDYGSNWISKKYEIDDVESFTHKLKIVAKSFGASLVGITDINIKWIYKTGFIRNRLESEDKAKEDIRKGNIKKDIFENRIILPEGINKAIILAIEMDKKGISTAPAQPAAAAASIAYSKMAFSIACLGEFFRNLGYRAIQCGNDTALSIPFAIEAGLGALGRNGLLITPEFGPRVRICKVFTDLPLVSDNPHSDFIKKVNNTCRECFRCAQACETNAISRNRSPTMNGNSISNNNGVLKYYVDVEKCFEFWIENSSDCGACIAACPFSEIEKSVSSHEFWD